MQALNARLSQQVRGDDAADRRAHRRPAITAPMPGICYETGGMEGIVCGPGGRYNTMPDERVDIPDFLDMIRIYTAGDPRHLRGRMTDPIEARHRFAEALAVEAGQLALEMRGRLGTPDAKTPTDFVTEADLAVERLIREPHRVQFRRQHDRRGGRRQRVGASVWVVDPIDGTTNFIHGGPRWCVSLGYVRDGVIELGVIYGPEDRRLFSARRGAGAPPERRADARSAVCGHGVAPLIEVGRADRTPIANYAELLTRFDGLGLVFRRRGSGALGLAEVAAGLQDGFVELRHPCLGLHGGHHPGARKPAAAATISWPMTG